MSYPIGEIDPAETKYPEDLDNHEPDYLTCLRCGHSWISRVSSPKACPECKTRRWNYPIINK